MLELLFSLWWLWVILAPIIIFIVLAILYTIVPADTADVVIKRGTRKVYSSHPDYATEQKAAYFKIPPWLPYAGMIVHRMPLKILSIPIPDFLAFDKDRARFICDIVAYAVVKKPIVAAMRFPKSMEELGKDVSKVVQATTRDSTTKKPIREIINDREGIIETINKPLSDALAHWGLELKDIELVEFKDPIEKIYGEEKNPQVIRHISSIIEVEIESDARQKNAEQKKIARVKEAEAEELATKREIQRDEEIGMRGKKKDQEIAKEHKKAREEELEVTRVNEVKTETINKERAVVEANKKKEVELVIKEQKALTGQGDRLMQEEQAKGEAAFIREKGYADADAKQKLQDALNKFGENAIRALIAEIVVEKDKVIGVETAQALKQADLKVFSGGDAGKQGFELGQLVKSLGVADEGGKLSLLNRISQPNDLGFKKFDMEELIAVISKNKELRDKLNKAIQEKDSETTGKRINPKAKRKVRKELP